MAGEVLLVRLRFPLLLIVVVGLIVYWPWLRNHFDRLVRPGGGLDSAISRDIEYWCPMCPGVLSDWPGKCPVCHMDLVRRTKGEATPLPDGVVARMQITPYRVQLAGIRTTPVEFRRLEWEAKAAGRLEQPEKGPLEISFDVSESGFAAVHKDMTADIEIEQFPGRPFVGRVREVASRIEPEARTFRARIVVDDPEHELKAGLFATVRLRAPLARIEASTRREREDWRDLTAAEIVLRSLTAFASPLPGLETLIDEAVRQASAHLGQILAIPSSSVIDTGDHKVVFVERMPGMFDGLEVTLGKRSGDYYPVIRGVAFGERVVTAGAFLLDAETRLNPSLAASYFGAGSRPVRQAATPAVPAGSNDDQLIARQKLCPVTDEELGSMGAPVKVMLDGRPVFICCKGCEKELRTNSKKYLAKIPLKSPSP